MKKRHFAIPIKIILKTLPLSFWLVLIFAFDKPYIAILTLISALIHEFGHVCAFVFFSKNYRIYGVSSGLRLSARGNLSYKEEMTIALCGPLINLLAFILSSPFIFLGYGEYAKIFGLINLFTAISNLIPIEGYDGYRILDCLINQYTKRTVSSLPMRVLSFFLSSVLCLAALYLIRSFDGGYWIFFIFLFSLFRAVCADSSVFPKNTRKK